MQLIAPAYGDLLGGDGTRYRDIASNCRGGTYPSELYREDRPPCGRPRRADGFEIKLLAKN